MDKYAVVTDEEVVKTASKRAACPGCGGNKVDYKGTTPHCERCGTKPWEKRGHSQR